jgi:Domain of unknown function (DUF4166)
MLSGLTGQSVAKGDSRMPTCFERPTRDSLPLMSTGVSEASRDAPRALYARLLGSSWLQVAEPVRCAHESEPTVRARGRLRVAHGASRSARVLARLLRLPLANDAAETQLIVTSCAGGEQWHRTFDGQRLDTRQFDAGASVLAERVGVLEFRFGLEVSGGSLVFRQLDAAVVLGSFRLRLPDRWAPRIEAREDPAGTGRIGVHVRVSLPVIGSLLTYDGTVVIEDTRA